MIFLSTEFVFPIQKISWKMKIDNSLQKCEKRFYVSIKRFFAPINFMSKKLN